MGIVVFLFLCKSIQIFALYPSCLGVCGLWVCVCVQVFLSVGSVVCGLLGVPAVCAIVPGSGFWFWFYYLVVFCCFVYLADYVFIFWVEC